MLDSSFSPSPDSDSDDSSLNNLSSPGASGPRIEVPELVQDCDLSTFDKLRLAEIYSDCFQAAPWNEKWNLAEAYAQIEKYLASDVDMIVLRQHGQVAGMVIGMPLSAYTSRNPSDAAKLESYADGKDPYYLADFTVDASQQGGGLGSKLITSFVTLADKAGYDSIITRTRIDNLSALRVFTRNGFMSKGIYSATTGGVLSDRTVLSRRL